MKVELRYATLPSPLGLFSAHYWFVVWDADGSHRWEVWQTKNAGGWSIGHVHCDLKPPDAGVGGGPARLGAEWTGATAGDGEAPRTSTLARHKVCTTCWQPVMLRRLFDALRRPSRPQAMREYSVVISAEMTLSLGARCCCGSALHS